MNLNSLSPRGGPAKDVNADPSTEGPEDWSALVATLCLLLVALAVLCTVLGVVPAR